jgi:cytohesin/brefeldin A-inhibited guanine nucleotide-exchange protein
MIIPTAMIGRLWDNFLLEGEIYIFRVAMGYLRYFQLELKVRESSDNCR